MSNGRAPEPSKLPFGTSRQRSPRPRQQSYSTDDVLKKLWPYRTIIVLIVSALSGSAITASYFLGGLKSNLDFFHENYPKLSAELDFFRQKYPTLATLRQADALAVGDEMKDIREGFLQLVEEIDGVNDIDLTNLRARFRRLFRADPGPVVEWPPVQNDLKEGEKRELVVLDTIEVDGNHWAVQRLPDGRFSPLAR